MKIEIRWRGLQKIEELEEHIRGRLAAVASKFGHRLRSVVVRLEDENGPKGGVDKLCSIEAWGPFGVRVAEGRGADLFVAAGQALHASARSLARAADRGRPFAGSY